MEVISRELIFLSLVSRKSTRQIIIHHSASPDVSALDIHHWHLNRGWSGIGYHYVIRENGTIEEGRPLRTIGAHAGPKVNHNSIGICLTGNFNNHYPTDDQIFALVELINWLKDYYGSDLEVLKHKDVGATSCPGDLFPWEELIEKLKGKKVLLEPETWKQEIMDKGISLKLITQDHNPEDPASKWFVAAVGLNLLKKLEDDYMILQVPKKITLKKFVDWIKENTRCEVKTGGNRVDVIVFADNVEPGKIVPLYAETKGSRVMVCELSNDYTSPEDAWHALKSGTANAYRAVPFHEWVEDQYLTAKNVKFQKFSL